MKYLWYSWRHVNFCAKNKESDPTKTVFANDRNKEITCTFVSSDPNGVEYKWKDKICVGIVTDDHS